MISAKGFDDDVDDDNGDDDNDDGDDDDGDDDNVMSCPYLIFVTGTTGGACVNFFCLV